MEFKDRLKELMQEKGIDIYGLSKATGISTSTILNYLKGRTFPGLLRLLALKQHFDVSMDYLMCRSDNKKPEPKRTRPHI